MTQLSTRLVCTLALLIGCAEPTTDTSPARIDEDGDGYEPSNDCDDTDPDIYPGAPETMGDGVDSDCDGLDPELSFNDDWNLVRFSAEQQGDDVFRDSVPDGRFTVQEHSGVLDGTLQQGDGTDRFALSGQVTAGELAGAFHYSANGTMSAYDLAVDWDCQASASEMSCQGITTLQTIALDGSALFVR